MTKSRKGEDKKKGDRQIFNKKVSIFFPLDGRRWEILGLVLKEFASLAYDYGTDQIAEKTR